MCSLWSSVSTKWVRQHREVLVLLRSHSETMLRSGGKKRCIKLDYYSICTRGLVYTTCVRSEESRATVRGPKGLRVQVLSPGRFRYRFQHSQNWYVTPEMVLSIHSMNCLIYESKLISSSLSWSQSSLPYFTLHHSINLLIEFFSGQTVSTL